VCDAWGKAKALKKEKRGKKDDWVGGGTLFHQASEGCASTNAEKRATS
jgi:hypothetical protein